MLSRNNFLGAPATPEGKVAVAERPTAAIAPTTVTPPPLAEIVEIPDVLTGRTGFCCGPAGTGKTYLARGWAAVEKGVVLAASTGIASANLGEGTTINALLRYFDTASLRDSYTTGRLTSILAKLAASGTTRILLDETSMVDGDQLTIITRALDELAGDGYILDERVAEELESDKRPISLTLVGDFAQLPPVKAPFAFESAEWERYATATHTLTRIRRQAAQEFIQAIQAARRGDATTVCDYFGPRMVGTTDAHFEGPTIFATNDAVSRYNALRLDQLTTLTRIFTATTWGKPRGDWKNIPERLPLKVGALVMLLANRRMIDSTKLEFANGDLATVLEADAQGRVIHVRLHRNDATALVTPITRTNTIPLEPGRRKALKEAGQAHLIDGKMEIVGGVTYLPVRLAWGTTVHKSQGLSLDAVQVNTRDHFFTAPSMVYVALSRARTVEGLRLVGTVDGLRARCTVNPKVAQWL